MNQTLREKIIRRIRAALAAVEHVGLVREACEDDGETIAATLTATPRRHAVEWEVGDDEFVDDDGTIVAGALGTTTARFRVGVLVHLADLREVDQSWSELASRVAASVAVMYTATETAGQWPDGTGADPLAMKTDTTDGGGAVFYSEERGTRAVFHGFAVTYRHGFGTPDGGAR